MLAALASVLSFSGCGSSGDDAIAPAGNAAIIGEVGGGQLANGDPRYFKTTPAPIAGLPGSAVAVAAGRNQTLALLADGTVYAWGGNEWGQLGVGTSDPASSPVKVPGISRAVAIACGIFHCAALLSDGTVRAWGGNFAGELGDGTTTNRPLPVTVVTSASDPRPLTGVRALSAGGEHTLALLGDGTVRAFGDNAYGELGNGTTSGSSTPVTVVAAAGSSSPLLGVLAIGAGASHSVAVLANGNVVGWGSDLHGELGDRGTSSYYPYPETMVTSQTDATPLAGAVEARGAYASTLVRLDDGSLRTCGSNRYGQLGVGSHSTWSAPLVVSASATDPSPLLFATEISANFYHHLAVLADGTVRAWGSNILGECGLGTMTHSESPPSPVTGLTGIIAAAAGEQHSVFLGSDGRVWTVGSNADGRLGDGTPSHVVAPAPLGLPPVTQIADGLALLADGTLRAWGRNDFNQLGDGTIVSRSDPRPVVTSASDSTPLSHVRSFALGTPSLALLADGTVRAWGSNINGAIGDGTYTDRAAPVTVVAGAGSQAPLSGVAAVAMAVNHAVALRSDGTVVAWGPNWFGQLGNATTNASPVPVTVVTSATDPTPLSGVVAIAGGANFTVALRSDGTVRTWGWNANGQLGDATTTNRSAPVDPGLHSVTAVAAGEFHAMALLSDGSVRAWGYNGNGQLGNGATADSPVPVTVWASATDPTPLRGVVQIGAGSLHSGARLQNGTIFIWGANGAGQLGDGTTTDRSAPVAASVPYAVQSLSLSDNDTFVTH